jgi:hypothetical protein
MAGLGFVLGFPLVMFGQLGQFRILSSTPKPEPEDET